MTALAPSPRFPTLAAALIGIVLFALAGRAALAALPSVSVSPASPICFASPSGTKQAALSYNLGGVPKAQLLVRDDTAQSVALDKQLTNQTGTETLPVQYGHVYSVQLLDVVSGRNLLPGPLAITTKVCDVTLPCVGCFKVTDIGVEPRGTWAAFNINANQPAAFLLELSKSPPVNGQLTNVVYSAKTNATIVSPWKPEVMPLDAQTTHYYLVAATNANGDIATKSGSFKTLTRSVTVKYDKVVINDDSDGWLAGACDCDLWFYVNGIQVGHAAGDFDDGDSSGTITPNFGTLTFNPSKPALALKVIGNDDDTDFGQFCPYGKPPSGAGSNDCHDWTNATKEITFPTGLGEVVPAKTVSFSSAYNPLKFTVTATFSVSYAP